MSWQHDQKKYESLKKIFDDCVKKITNYETRKLPADEVEKIERKETYKTELIESYNNLTAYVKAVYANVNETSRTILKNAVDNSKLRILRALLVLDLTIDLPDKFEQIQVENIVHKDELADGVDNTQIFVNLSGVQQQASNAGDFHDSRIDKPQDKAGGSESANNKNTTDDNSTLTVPLSLSSNIDSEHISKTNSTNSVEKTPANSRRNSIEVFNQNTVKMTLPLSDILNGIPDFSCKNHDEVRQFIAKADLIYTLAETQGATVLSVIRTKLVTANKLGDISNKTWPEIKVKINEKYRVSMSFETAQERLLSIRQNQGESLDAYANRTKILLDALNSASFNENADVINANHKNNENLAICIFKQNVFDEKIRMMALSTEHSSLTEAIAHATEKKEALQSSNISRETPKNDNKNEQNGKNSNGNKANNGKKNNNKKREQCMHCKKTNHASDRCFFRQRDGQASNDKGEDKPEKFANRAKDSKHVNVAGTEEDSDAQPSTSTIDHPLGGTLHMQPYRYLNIKTASVGLPVQPDREPNDMENIMKVVGKICQENNDITITIDISICNRPVKLLVDSGAHATMLKSNLIKSNILYYPQVRYAMVGINGPNNPVMTHGATYGNVVICGIKMQSQFQIADDRMHLNYDGILGLDFMMQYKAIIDMSNMTLAVTLPPWHNMYEEDERHMFGRSYPNIKITSKNNELMYSENEIKSQTNSVGKKAGKLTAHVNRLELYKCADLDINEGVKLAPYTTRNFTVDVPGEVLCKAKMFTAGVFMTDTIIHEGNNTVTVVNNSDETVRLNSLEVETEPISNYNVFRLKKTASNDSQRRIKVILDTMDMSHCNDHEKKMIEKLVSEYYDVFYMEGDGLSFAKGAEHRIPTEPNINPINVRQYKTSDGQKSIIQEKIQQILKDDIIEPSTSLWDFPIVLAPKKIIG